MAEPNVPEKWDDAEVDMENDPTINVQYKRKQVSSPPLDLFATKKKPQMMPKVPTTTSTAGSLLSATRATEYACELVKSLADEYFSEEHIGPCLSKVVKALEQVCNALTHLSRERDTTADSSQRRKTDASTSTDSLNPPTKPKFDTVSADRDPETGTLSVKPGNRNQRKPTKNTSRTSTGKTRPAIRSPEDSASAKKKSAASVDAGKQPEKNEPNGDEEPFILVAKTKKKTNVPRPEPIRKTVHRPAAVLVKVADGKSYADTLRDVRRTQIDFDAMGTHVTTIRKTLKGDLLVELTKGNKATAATLKIQNELSKQLPGTIVTRLRHTTEVEIMDLDEVTTKEEVLAAILKAIPGDDLPSEEVKVNGPWATRDGRQMATATVPISVSQSLTFIRVGWSQCRVRPRRPEPARCYRCHGFGHSTRQCTGPDLTTACRRCGVNGHIQASCTEGDDRCVACDRINSTRVSHKPGSGACAARKKAISDMNATVNRR